MTVLAAQGLAIGFAHRTLAADISFALSPGEAMAVLGPNGCGKTTLFRTLMGLAAARHGTVRLDDQAIDAMTPAAIARAIAYVPQAARGLPGFSVIEVVQMGRAAHLPWYAQPGPRDRGIAQHALREVNIADFAEREFAELSGGEQQLVMIARALATGAPIILLDEPTASLDFGNQFLILDELARLKQRGTSVLFTTHNPDQALRIADRTLTISRDGVVNVGPTRAVVTRDSLAALYAIDVQLMAGPGGQLITVAAGPS